MPSSGGTTGTPISPGPGTGLTIAEALPATLLSLPRYAQLIGINPVHFMGATAPSAGIGIFPVSRNTCNDLWPRYSWQSADRVSHYDLALAIRDAEEAIAELLGWYPAPTFIAEEIHQMPRHYRRDVWRSGALNVRGQRVSIQTEFAKVLAGGQRAVDFINTATTGGGSLVYSDEDGDGFAETATITLATTLASAFARGIKIYFADKAGAPEWEIRPARSKTITASGYFVAVLPSWLFIDPDVLAAYPTTVGYAAVDVSTVANYVTSVDVYLEYLNDIVISSQFYWEPQPRSIAPLTGYCTQCSGEGCPACEFTTQDGCLHVRDANLGIVVPQPATYDSDNTSWYQNTYVYDRDPDFVKIWYQAGLLDNDYLKGQTLDPLSLFWAQAIAWLTTARLERPFCSCANVMSLCDKMRQDLAFTGTDTAYQISESDIGNPLGTKRGEILCWKRISKFADQVPSGCALV